jgi:hypothetical protein
LIPDNSRIEVAPFDRANFSAIKENPDEKARKKK